MKAGHVVVRRAGPADNEAMKAILQDTLASIWRPNISPAAAQAYLDVDRGGAYVDEYGHVFRIAELDGEVEALVHWYFIQSLHVRPRHARRSLGGRLMDVAERKIASVGFAQARLETNTFNEASRAFYAARGYAEAGRYPDEEWNSGLTTILFVKQLG